jgi:hypothetical protein
LKKKKKSVVIPLQVLNNPDADQQQNQDNDDDDAPRINNTQYNPEIFCTHFYYIMCITFTVIVVPFFMTYSHISKNSFRILKRLAEDWIPSIITCIFLPLLLFRKRPAVKTFISEWYTM